MNNALIKMLEKEKEQLLLKLKVVEHAIVAYQHSSFIDDGEHFINHATDDCNKNLLATIQAFVQKYQHFNPAESTRNKILFIIKTEGRFLHVREIARIVQQLDDEISITAVIKKISPALSILKRIPGSPLISVEVAQSHFNTFWGYSNWLNDDNTIKDGFMYNEAEITKLQRESVFNWAV